MEVAIKNNVSLTIVSNLVVNQLMECEVTMVVIAKVASTKEPKWTTVMAKNVCQVVSQAVETLVDAPKEGECKFNLCFTGFKAKEGETEKELVQWPNEVARQGYSRHTTTIAIARASAPMVVVCPSMVLFKFATRKDR
jgi:hypothetical protein